MKYVPLSIARPLATPLAPRGYNGCFGYKPPPESESVANVANVATMAGCERDALAEYLHRMNSAEVAHLEGLPPTPYTAAPCEAWEAQALHGAAWAAWWAAVARQRAFMRAGRV